MTPHEKPYVVEVGGMVVGCADARSAADLIRELQDEGPRAPRARKGNGLGLTAKKALLEGQYKTGVDLLMANVEGVFADELVAKLGFQDNPKALGGYMTGLRNQCRKAGLPGNAIIRERRKNSHGWKNHLRLDEKSAETLKRWLET